MTPTTAVHKIFILDLTRIHRPIQEVTAEIKVCGKTTWAEVWDCRRRAPRRYLLGSSAFYSRKAAEKRKLADMRKIMEGSYHRYAAYSGLPGGHVFPEIQNQMAEYKATGTIH